MKKNASAAEPQLLPFSPWQSPPLGSLGDAWDGVLELPRDATTAAREDRERQAAEAERARRERRVEAVAPLRGQIHMAVIAAWVVNAMALTSTGPAVLLRQPLAVVAFLLAAAGIWRIRTAAVLERGIPHAVAAMAAAVALFALGFV